MKLVILENPKLLGNVITYFSGDVVSNLTTSYIVYYKFDASYLALVEREGNKYIVNTADKNSFVDQCSLNIEQALLDMNISEDGLTLIDYNLVKRLGLFKMGKDSPKLEMYEVEWNVFPGVPPFGVKKTLAISWEFSRTSVYLVDRETLALAKLVFISNLEKFASNEGGVLSLLGLEAIQQLTMPLQISPLPIHAVEDVVKGNESFLGGTMKLPPSCLKTLGAMEKDFFEKAKNTLVEEEKERETLTVSMDELVVLINEEILPQKGDPDFINRLEVKEFPASKKPAIQKVVYTYGVLYVYVPKGFKRPSKSEVSNFLGLTKPVTMNVQTIGG